LTVIASEAKQSTLAFLLRHGLLRFARNDDRKAAFLYAPGPLYGLRQKAKFLNGIKLIWVVQSSIKKYFHFLLTQITCISLAIPSHTEGRFAIVTDVGHGMRWTWAAHLTRARLADGEVVWS
jgi:hypothetical protein